MKLGELIVQLGVNADTFTVRQFGKAMLDIPFAAASAIASLAGVTVGFGALTATVLDMTNGFNIFTATTGYGADELNKWQMAAKQMGVSADVATRSIMRLSAFTGGIKTGMNVDQGMLQLMGKLGIDQRNWYSDPSRLLAIIQGRMAGMNAQIATDWLATAHLDPSLLRIFQMPPAQREAIRPEMDQSQIRTMADFQKQLTNLEQGVLRNFADVLVGMEPYMAHLTKALEKFVTWAGGQGVSFVKGIDQWAYATPEKRESLMAQAVADAVKSAVQSLGTTTGKNITLNNTIHTLGDMASLQSSFLGFLEMAFAKAVADYGQAGH